MSGMKWEIPSFDTRSLALFRLALGLLFLFDLVFRSFDLVAHYTDAGVFPREAFDLVDRFFSRDKNPSMTWSLHALSGSRLWVLGLFLLQGVLGLLFVLGWRTRWVHFASWFLLVSLQSRNPLIIYGADHVLRVLFFFSFFLPLGSRWSLDACAKRNTCHTHPLAALAFTLQLAQLYGFSVLLKYHEVWRSTFTAGLMSLKVDFYTTQLGTWLSQFPELLKVLTFVVVAVELLGALFLLFGLFLPKLRWWAIGMLCSLQLGLALSFHLGAFQWVSVIALIPFLLWRSSEAFQSRENRSWGVWAMAFVTLVFWVNINTLPNKGFLKWKALDMAAEVFRLDQSWGLFAPYPLTDDGWFVMRGVFDNGEVVNLLSSDVPLDGEKPQMYAATFKGHRWRKCFLRLRREAGDPFIPYVLDWMGRNPSYFIEGSRGALQSLELSFYQEITDFDGHEAPPERFKLGSVIINPTKRK